MINANIAFPSNFITSAGAATAVTAVAARNAGLLLGGLTGGDRGTLRQSKSPPSASIRSLLVLIQRSTILCCDEAVCWCA